MNINLRTGEIISQQKLDVLKVAQNLGQISIDVLHLECKAEFIGEATVWSTVDIKYLVKYVTKDYICLQQIATYECRDGIQISKYYCSVTNGFGYDDVAPNKILNYKYVVIPTMYIKWN